MLDRKVRIGAGVGWGGGWGGWGGAEVTGEDPVALSVASGAQLLQQRAAESLPVVWANSSYSTGATACSGPPCIQGSYGNAGETAHLNK